MLSDGSRNASPSLGVFAISQRISASLPRCTLLVMSRAAGTPGISVAKTRSPADNLLQNQQNSGSAGSGEAAAGSPAGHLRIAQAIEPRWALPWAKLAHGPARVTFARERWLCWHDHHCHRRSDAGLHSTKLFRLVQISGSHDLCFSDPTRLAQAIMMGSRG